MMDDIIELVADVAADLLGEILPNRNTKPLMRFLWGLAGAAAVGLLCWGIVTVCIQ